MVLDSRDLNESFESCRYYLSQSSIRGAGNGIFSTSKLYKSSLIELSIAIYVRYSHIYESDLEDYIFATTDDLYGMVLLGLASLLNHNPINNAEYYSEGNYADDVLPSSRENKSNLIIESRVFSLTYSLKIKSQLFSP